MRPDAGWTAYLEALDAPYVVVQFWAIITLLYVFPDGIATGRRGHLVLQAFTGWAVLMGLAGLLAPGPLLITGRANPLGVGPAWLTTAFEAGLWGIPLGVAAGTAVLVARWRRAEGTERAQLKWFVSAAGLVIAVVALIMVVPEEADVDVVAIAVVVTGFWALPAAIVTAVLRYRLYDIDRLVSRTVTYGVVAGLLAAVYVTGVFLLSGVLPLEGDLAVAASTLAVAGLLHPVHRTVRQVVERRFNRPRYDAARELERFTASLRDEVDLHDLTSGLLDVVASTMQPSTAAVWIRPVGGPAPG
jgi:hypothetical protein